MASVVVSRIGLSLWVMPAWRTSVDTAAVDAVLLRYGRRLLPGALEANEAVVAEELTLREAHQLATELEALGLTTRAVDRDQLKQSARIGRAIPAYALAMMFTLPMGVLTLTSSKFPPEMAWLILPGVVALMAMLTVLSRGAARLQRATEDETPMSAELRALCDTLPAHVIDPIRHDLASLEAQARSVPGGAAEEALQALLVELVAERDAQAAEAVQDVRTRLEAARHAARELG